MHFFENSLIDFTKSVATASLEILNDTYDELSRIFNYEPTNKVVLRFLSPEEFKEQTGAPPWTSAMFYRGEISIPIKPGERINKSDLRRALRHEFVHAVIAELSGYRCPAWLDEGLAQLIEGEPNPLLGPALRRWIKDNEAMPMDWLHNGFTTLDSSLVPTAYAESLFATRSLVNTLGMGSLVKYLRQLRENTEERVAFEKAFGRTKAQFEGQLTKQIQRWSASGQFHP